MTDSLHPVSREVDPERQARPEPSRKRCAVYRANLSQAFYFEAARNWSHHDPTSMLAGPFMSGLRLSDVRCISRV